MSAEIHEEGLTCDVKLYVKLYVRLPRAWTERLKEIAAHHYDATCREAGTCGVINGLHNVADPEWMSTYPITQSDCNLMMKVMEQSSPHAKTLEDIQVDVELREWISKTFKRLGDEWRRLNVPATGG